MKQKIISMLIGSAAILSAASCFADSGTANIHFKGTVANMSCTVQVNNASGDASLEMGTIDISKVAVGGASDPYAFEVELTGCPSSMQGAEVTFMGTPSTDNQYFSVNGTDDSLGLAISDTTSGESATTAPVLPNVLDPYGMRKDGTNGFKGTYTAQLVKLKEGVTNTSFDVSTSVNIAYM